MSRMIHLREANALKNAKRLFNVVWAQDNQNLSFSHQQTVYQEPF